MATEITVVKVEAEETWTCECCEKGDVVAYIAESDVEETHGYCAECLDGAIRVALVEAGVK